jgi:two-component system phosphate regulon sensor histidine kinase PhoR
MMKKDTDRLKKLISSILEISKLEQKRIAHDYHIYNADDIFKELVQGSANQFRISHGSVKFEGSAEYKCVIDKEAMQIVFDNLLSNSIKYSPEEADITVKLMHNEKYILISSRQRSVLIKIKQNFR